MTKAQRTLIEIQGRQSELRSRLAVLAAQDTRTADEETELTAVETKLSGCEPELRAALAAAAAEDDSARTVQTTDSEGRERLELRSKTGVADFLKAAVGGAAVTGAAAEYADACGVPTVGHLPMAIFARTAPTVETRAVTPGPSVTDRCGRPSRSCSSGQPRHPSVSPCRPSSPDRSDPEDHNRATGGHAAKRRRGSFHSGGGHVGQSVARPHRRATRSQG